MRSESAWRPKTIFRGCQVFDERNELGFVREERLARAALMCPAFGVPLVETHGLMDTIGSGNMYIRSNKLELFSAAP